EVGLAVLGVDHRPGEGAVEAVDRAGWQRPLRARGVGLARGVERGRRPAVLVDRQHLRGGEGVGRDPDVDLVDVGLWRADIAGPELMPLVAQRVLLAEPGA